jgi:hypothetical protein
MIRFILRVALLLFPLAFVTNSAYGAQTSLEAYEALPMTAEESKIIAKLISTMAEKNVVQLMFEKKDLERKGKRVNCVHPLKFIGTICADPYLKHCIQVVRKSHFKWDNFVDGMKRRLKEEAASNNVLPYIQGLASKLKLDANAMLSYVTREDWEGLVTFITQS